MAVNHTPPATRRSMLLYSESAQQPSSVDPREERFDPSLQNGSQQQGNGVPEVMRQNGGSDEIVNGDRGKKLSIQLAASPVLTYRNSIDLPYVPIPIEASDLRKGSYSDLPSKLPNGDHSPWDGAEDPNAPKDKCYFVGITLFVLGFTGMLPMTMLITANEYWMYKFRDVNTPWANYSASNRTQLQVNFASYHFMAAIAPSVFFNFISTFIGHKVKMNIRARLYFLVLIGIFVANTAFTQINTDSWQMGFFLLTMGSQVLMSFADSLGIVILPITAKFPKKYLQLHLVGHGLAGIVTSGLRLISIAVSPDTTGAAYLYFSTGTALMFVSYISFEIMKSSGYYKYYVTNTEKVETKREVNSLSTVLRITKQVWPILVLNVMSFSIPIGCITTLVVSEGQGNHSAWSDKYFVTVATYLIPSVAEIIGRALSNASIKRFLNKKFLATATILKILIFTPLVYLSNAQPRHHLPVLLNHDWEYMLMNFVGGAIMGYLMNLNMLWTTSLVAHKDMELGFRVVMMVMGVMGSIFSPLNVLAVNIL